MMFCQHVLSTWCFVNMMFSSTWCFINMMLHQHDASSAWRFISMTLHQHDASSAWCFISMMLHQHDASSAWCFISMTLHQHDASSAWCFISMTLHQHDVSSKYYISLTFHQPLWLLFKKSNFTWPRHKVQLTNILLLSSNLPFIEFLCELQKQQVDEMTCYHIIYINAAKNKHSSLFCLERQWHRKMLTKLEPGGARCFSLTIRHSFWILKKIDASWLFQCLTNI
jgi:hypothetical protein